MIKKKLYSFIVLAFIACTPLTDAPSVYLQGRLLILGDSITHIGTYVSFMDYILAKDFPNQDFDIVAIGLSGETASGLTEPGSEYPRPCVLYRIDSALSKLKPNAVAVCYGMNDGIYTTQSDSNFQAYKNGMTTVIKKIYSEGAHVILLTPPPFDPRAAAYKVTCSDSIGYSYAHPWCGYDSVLADYADWIMSLQQPGLLTVDFHSVLSKYIAEKRSTDSNYIISPDGVHPDSVGHLLMARAFLHAIGIPTDSTDADVAAGEIMNTELYTLAAKRREILSDSWRNVVGHNHHRQWPGLPLAVAERKADSLRSAIHKLLKRQ